MQRAATWKGMEMKKKLLKRIGALLCAVVVAVSTFGASGIYYADDLSHVYEFINNNLSYWKVDSKFDYTTDYIYSDEYPYYVITQNASGTSMELLCSNEPISIRLNEISNGKFYAYYFVKSGYYFAWNNSVSAWVNPYDFTSSGVRSFINDITYSSYRGSLTNGFVTSNCDVYFEDSDFKLFSSPNSNFGGTYNSALGYIQNVKRQTLYLENDAFALIDDTLKYQFTFDKTTTTGLDITDGNWSVRHYMQVEVKNAKRDYETVKIYDKVLMGEYSADNCKVGYMFKDIASKLHIESEFDGLSWWESNGLGYITYYNDYFQLVRVNDDGSVEYGGYVKVWQDEFNINHSATLGEDESPDDSGYNDDIVDGSHGSGSSYEEAEHEADENLNTDDLDEFENIMNDYVSTLGSIPRMISNMFGFMPTWCLGVVALSFSFVGILIVYKLIRG